MTAPPPDLALAYDATFSDRVSRAEDEAVRRLVQPFVDGRDVLDVGCGTGLGLSMGHPRSYLGIDASPLMISRARERWHADHWAPSPRVDANPLDADRYTLPAAPQFAVCPAETFRADEASFDTVLCLWALPYLDAPAAVVNSWYPILRPGGAAIIVSWDARYRPTWPIAHLAAPLELVASSAELAGFRAVPLGGLMRRETARRWARCLPVAWAASVIERGAQSPAYVLCLRKPGGIATAPPRRAPVRPLVQRSMLGGRPVPFGPGREWGGP